MNPAGPGVEKTHPVTREMLPDDPLLMQGIELPGDPLWMLQVMVEEYAHLGCDVDTIMQLARDPDYQAFYALRVMYGEQRLRERVGEVIKGCGVLQVTTSERQVPDRLIQLEMPD